MTFRVRPNTKNLPAAGGGAKAGTPLRRPAASRTRVLPSRSVCCVAEKNDPESETGLRVLQSGGGEVGSMPAVLSEKKKKKKRVLY